MWNTNKFNQLATHCLQRTANTNPGNNPLISPLSILSVLFILMDAANGKTREECLKLVKGMVSLNDFKALYENSSKALSFSNEIQIQKDIMDTIDPTFIQCFKSKYNGKICNPEHLTGLINFINTISFESTWSKPFKDNNRDWFTNQDGSKSRCQMMRRTETMYIENQSFTGFIKSYTSPDAFMALLPKEKDYDSLLRSIEQCNFTQLFESAYPEDVEIAMPQFESKYKTDLTNFLRDLGIHELFTEAADFSRMTSVHLQNGKILHESQIKFFQIKTVAFAKTIVAMDYGIDFEYDSRSIILNRPFIYAIMHFDSVSQQFIPVFVGVLNQL